MNIEMSFVTLCMGIYKYEFDRTNLNMNNKLQTINNNNNSNNNTTIKHVF